VDEQRDRFHEVFRRVPQTGDASGLFRHDRWNINDSGGVILPPITLPLASVVEGMVQIAGSDDFVMGDESSQEVPPHHRRVPPFLLDAREVTISEYERSPEFPVDKAIESADPNAAVTYVNFHHALAWAEHAGKCLPTETMYEFAATNGSRGRFPWGNDPQPAEVWRFGSSEVAAYDISLTQPPLVGLFSNVAEWTSTWLQMYPRTKAEGTVIPVEPREYRVVRGAPSSVIEGVPGTSDWAAGARSRTMLSRLQSKPTVGFRCARSIRPHLTAADFEAILRDGR
jgi:formylglycine-generating enzyme required for sulfatase activity